MRHLNYLTQYRLAIAFFLFFIPGITESAHLQKAALVAVDVPGTGLAVPQPEGFDKSTSFHGFQQPSTGASVMITVIPGPFSEVAKGFNKPALAARGMELRSKKRCKIGEQSGFLLHIAQQANNLMYLKWIVVFGDAKETRMVTATFPAAQSKKLGETLRDVVLATVPANSNVKTTQLPFTLKSVDGLVAVKKVVAMGKMAAFTKDGRIPTASPLDPMFIVAPSLGNVNITDRKQFAMQRLRGTAHTNIDTITAVADVQIDHASGFEIVAQGHDQKSKAKLVIYQVMLFPKKDRYVLMTGLIGQANSETFLRKFRKLSQSYESSSK